LSLAALWGISRDSCNDDRRRSRLSLLQITWALQGCPRTAAVTAAERREPLKVVEEVKIEM
jgi:hypothetical protein